MEIHLKVIGVLLMLLSAIHLAFPKYFSWKQELSSLSLVNRQMMYVHTFFIALVILLIGILSFTLSEDLVTTALGKQISLGIGLFWGIRLYFQFFGYSSKLWRGKVFETVIHILFSILWIYLTCVFLLIYSA
jgi:hypothetical protein